MRSFLPKSRHRSRVVVAAVAVTVAGVILAGCSAATPAATSTSKGSARLSGTITAAEWGGTWDTALQQLSPGFQTATGVTVNNTVNAGNVVTQLQQNPGSYDLAWTIGTTAIQSYTSGVTQAIDVKKIKAWKNLNPILKKAMTVDGKVVAIPISYGAEGILYRKDLVPFKITSWKDLWDPRLKGAVTIQQAPAIGGLMTMMAGAKEYGTGITDYSAGFTSMKKLAPNIQYLYTVSSDPLNGLAAGTVKAAVTFANYGVPLESKNVGIVIPKDGAPWSVQAISIPKASKNKAAVYAYINYMLTKINQVSWADAASIKPARDDVTLPASVQSKVLETADVSKNLWPIDWQSFSDNTADWTTKWQAIFSK
jgi:spermidine/putrescine-binding protein